MTHHSAENSLQTFCRTTIWLAISIGLIFWTVVTMDPWLDADSGFVRILLNVFPALIILALLLGAFGRLIPAIGLTICTLVTLFYINDIKIRELEQPILLTDYLLWRQVYSGSSLLGHYANIPALGASVLIVALLILFSRSLEPVRLTGSKRWAIVVSALLIALTGLSSPVHRSYAGLSSLDTPWHQLTNVKNTGLIASLIKSAGQDFYALPQPNPHDVAEVRKWLSTDDIDTLPVLNRGTQPDVVVVLSESFFDPGILEGVDRCIALPVWCQLLEQGVSGTLEVPTFGGNTTRTEYEVLTGVPYSILPDGIYPYLSVVTRPTLSLAWVMRAQGYQTTALHPHIGSFWQRNRAMPMLGFEEFITEKHMETASRVGHYISDRSMTDRILNILAEESEQPRFIFAISMENHGPWTSHRPNMDAERLATLPTPESLTGASRTEWKTYLYHARNATEQLQRLVEQTRQFERPVTILFFGDHLPGLHRVFEQLSFHNRAAAYSQATPYLLLDSHQQTLDWQPKHAYELPGWLISLVGGQPPEIYLALSRLHRWHHTDLQATLSPRLKNALYHELLVADVYEILPSDP